MRHKQPRNFDRRNPFVLHFANSLELPPQVFGGLDAAAAAERRTQISNEIANEIERRYSTWS